jgi:two-component system, OmpR family, KDP operon response regulator KdpE
MSSSVLVVDSDPDVVKVVTSMLVGGGYDVLKASGAESALSSIRDQCPALMIADLDIPLVDGIELCRRVRQTSSIPIIIMSGNGDGRSEIEALDSGADDYIAKPFSASRLLARVRVALRRTDGAPEDAPALGVGEFHIDFHDRRVRVNGQPIRLTPKEFDLFVFMARHPNRVLAHRTLLGAVWGEASGDQPEYLRVFVGQLRKKLESNPSQPRYIVTEPWVGYRFNPTGLVH